jgi:DNA-directed RNA polymerase subunit RPC12/RpoP
MSESNSPETSSPPPLLEPCGHCGAELDVTSAEPLEDVVCPRCGGVTQARLLLKNYRIQGVLGSGGMGSVYKALDLNLNREIALKVINREFSSDPEHLKKFEEEARITALVNHPNVVKIFSFGSDRGVLFIAMELADKGNLDDLMTLQGRIAEAQALEVGIQIAEGLWAAHKRGLIHRDVKPGNILFTDAHTAKIVDFGLACLVDEMTEASGDVWGTPYYVAPEKLNLQPEDFRSDIYSLGATLFHAIAGRPPHEAETASMVALKHIKSKAVSLQAFAPDVSSATAFVINRMLQQDPEGRYQSYAELVEHLTYARTKLLEEVEKPFKAKEQVAMESEKEQGVVAWIVFAVLVLMLLAGMGFIFFGNGIFKKEAVESGNASPQTAASATGERTGEMAGNKDLRARKLLRDGDYDGAATALAELALLPDLPQPLGRWIYLHQGMAALLSGNSFIAKQAFTKLAQVAAPAPSDKTLANFFAESGRLLSADAPVTPDVAANYNSGNVEALAFFLYALHDWQLSQFDDAEALFQAFLKTQPVADSEWISEFKPTAKKYLADLDAYKKIKARIASVGTTQARSDVLQELQGMKSPPLQPGKLPDILLELQAGLEQKVAGESAAEAQKQAAAAEKQTAEAQKHEAELATEHEKQNRTLSEAKAKITPLLAGMQYDEALAVAQGVRVTSRDLEDEKALLMKKPQWLQAFKATLSGDLSSTGYPGPVVKRIGAAVSGVVHKATKSEIVIQTPYGGMGVQWLEIAPSGILAMADYFTQKNTQPDAIADRLWLSGVFAFQVGLQKEGLLRLNRAAEKKADYKDFLPMFGDAPAR